MNYEYWWVRCSIDDSVTVARYDLKFRMWLILDCDLAHTIGDFNEYYTQLERIDAYK